MNFVLVNSLLAAATLAMMGWMLWVLFFRLRRDRVISRREETRGKFAFRPRERVRFLLNRSFEPAADEPDWAEPLVSRLSQIEPREPGEPKSAFPHISSADQ